MDFASRASHHKNMLNIHPPRYNKSPSSQLSNNIVFFSPRSTKRKSLASKIFSKHTPIMLQDEEIRLIKKQKQNESKEKFLKDQLHLTQKDLNFAKSRYKSTMINKKRREYLFKLREKLPKRSQGLYTEIEMRHKIFREEARLYHQKRRITEVREARSPRNNRRINTN